MIPVVFTHRLGVKSGSQGYLPLAIQQAQQYNDRVILIGDRSNAHLNVEHYYYGEYAQEADAFRPHYVHMCTNERSFELWCLQRHFILRDFMAAQGLDKMFLCDSDVMLYCNVSTLETELEQYDLACNWAHTQWKYRWSSSAHVSYWTRDVLAGFCDFIWETYTTLSGMATLREKWKWHVASGTHGGICDMTLLWLFIQDKNALNLARNTEERGAVFDNNINAPHNWLNDEYAMENGIKEISWRANQPLGYNFYGDEWIRFLGLHFQGNAKRLMHDYFRRAW